MKQTLVRAREHGLDVPFEEASYFIGHNRVLPAGSKGMARWRQMIVAYLSRNALDPTSYFGIPPKNVVEFGAQVRLS